ncbi:MAG: PAS domain S-box protein [Gemmatimonadota bacterium]
MSSPDTHTNVLRVLMRTDDQRDVDLLLRELQGYFDVSADLAASAEDYLDRLDSKSHDLVVSDYRLHFGTGMDALAALQARKLDTPFILLTDALGDELVIECVKQGVADLVLKSNLARLPVAVRSALERRELSRKRARDQDLIHKLMLAVDQSPASVIITDPAGTIEYVNARFTKVSGYSAAEVVGRNPRMWQSGEVPAEVYQELWQTIKRGDVWQGEILNRQKSGELYWDAVIISPIRDADNTITHFLAMQEDITERRRTEQVLRDREERFTQLAENINEVFYIMDARFSETLYVNSAYETIWGRTRQSLYENPSSFIDPVVEEDRPALLASIERNQRGEESGYVDFRIVRPDGEVRWILTKAVSIRNERDEVYRLSGIARDVTRQHRAEIALQESEARFRDLAEASFDAMDIAENDIIREANKGFEKTFGYTADEAVGRAVLDFVAEESREEVQRRLEDNLEGTYELVGQRKDGTKVLLEATAKSTTVDGRPGRITALRDVTEKRLLEDQFRQAQKMEAVGRLAGGVAHDFNNLLTVISSYADLTLEDFAPNDPRRDGLEEIRRAAEAAASLTRQLLAFSRQQLIEPRIVELTETVTTVAKMLKRLIGEDIKLETVFKERGLRVLIDPGQLEQVIMNLAVNARDAMPTGGRLTIEVATADLSADYARTHWPVAAGTFVMIAMTDTGAGMDSATRARIFEPFFTTKEQGKGTGLGLATVYGIVKQSGGFIWVYSEPGQGATFKIYFPLAEQHEVPVGELEGTQRVPGGSETILIVEDAAHVRMAVKQILMRYGYTVLEAPDGQVALHYAARAVRVDLLLTDVVMPGVSGRVLAEQFTARRPGVKVLFMSGYTDDAVMRHGVLNRDTAYLQKPFSAEALARKVREVLDAGSPSEITG